MNSITKKVYLFCLLFCCLCLKGYSQQYRIHLTERTIKFTADNVNPYNISNCVGGVFIARESKNNVSYIIDTLCNTLGAIHLTSGIGSFFPNFYGGQVATAILNNGTPAIINTKGEIVKLFPEGTGISSHFVDGIALLSIINPETHKPQVIYIDKNGDQIYKDLAMNASIKGRGLDVSPLCDGLRKYYDSNNRLYGYINESGQIVIPARFKKAHDFSDSLAAFSYQDGSIEYWGFIDTTGKEVIKPIFRNEPGDFHDGHAIIQKQNGKFVFIDKNANVKTKEYSRAARFFHGYALVNAQDQYGDDLSKCYVVNTSFRRIRTIDFCILSDLEYNEYNKTFTMGGAVFYHDGIMKLNTSQYGHLIRNFVEDIALFSCDKYTGFINSKGEVLMVFVQSEF